MVVNISIFKAKITMPCIAFVDNLLSLLKKVMVIYTINENVWASLSFYHLVGILQMKSIIFQNTTTHEMHASSIYQSYPYLEGKVFGTLNAPVDLILKLAVISFTVTIDCNQRTGTKIPISPVQNVL